MTNPDPADLMVREPTPAEMGRALYLFRAAPLPPQARLFVAVKTRPLERFVAAAAWWPQGNILSFRLAVQPGTAFRLAACNLLIQQLMDCGRALGITTIQYGDLLVEDNEWIQELRANGFMLSHSERFFEISTHGTWTRIMEIADQLRDKFPPAWRTESIRHHKPEVILDFIEPNRLMPPEEVHARWREDSPYGFEMDMSDLLFDGTRLVGVLLMRPVLDMLCVDVRMVQAGNRLLNSLGNLALFRHSAAIHGLVGRDMNRRQFNRMQFRGGELEHRETANLAFRMGGKELPPRHIFARTI